MGDFIVCQLSHMATQNIYNRAHDYYDLVVLMPHETSEAAPHALVWALPETEVSVDDNLEAVIKAVVEHLPYARGLERMRFWSVWPQGYPDTPFYKFAAYEARVEDNGSHTFGDMVGIVELAQALQLPVAMLKALLPRQNSAVHEPLLSMAAA
jgi:hypothetical protein